MATYSAANREATHFWHTLPKAEQRRVLEVECAHCGSLPGRPCTVLKTGGRSWTPHGQRVRAAYPAAARELAIPLKGIAGAASE